MRVYEMIAEHFDNCSGRANPLVSEIETDDLDAFVQSLMPPKSNVEKCEQNGEILYEVTANGLRTRYSFTEI